MARESYDRQLKYLKDQMLLLGSMLQEALSETIRALVTQDVEKARSVSAGDERINAQVRRIEQECYMLFLRQQPIAKDLRSVSAVMKMITDMERIGDHAADISELVIYMSKEPYPEEIHVIEQMAKETTVMLIEAVDAFAGKSVEKAEGVIRRDDRVDKLFVQVKKDICEHMKTIDTTKSTMIELDLLMVAKYFERIGDHATNIAEWVLFSISGDVSEIS
ncbi:MAG: phosphate signaling complex protein PhoU [Eubacterium sp.]|nr:phosphate signaling complex protein PhoU [Eubacterium sp.]